MGTRIDVKSFKKRGRYAITFWFLKKKGKRVIFNPERLINRESEI